LLSSQGLQMFHVMTRFATTSGVAPTGGDPEKGTPTGALGPTRTMQATIKAPTSKRMRLADTVVS
jgi:hypothetical protein